MFKFQKKPAVFEFLRPQNNLTPDAGQNPRATKFPLPLRAGDKIDGSWKKEYDTIRHHHLQL